MPRPAADTGHLSRLWPIWLLWVVFVVYGSLVPLDFQPLPWSVAWQKLLQAPMFKLGIESRADWVANGVLYLPVGFLTTGAMMGRRARLGRKLLAGLLGLGFGVSLALAVELAQTAFPPRTVSRNDMLAESIGSALGMLLAWAGAARFRLLLASFDRGGNLLAERLAPFYALVFLALALFPFDLLLDAQEWRAKLDGPLVGLWLAESSQGLGRVKLLAKLLVETAAVLPLGALWVARRARSLRHGPAATVQADLWRALGLGAALGLLLESAQLTLASGQSQGLSVLTRMLGFALGAAAWQRHSALQAESLRAGLRRFSVPMLCTTLALLVVYNSAWQGPWLAPDDALLRLQRDVRFVPFYYHYFTSEMHAVTSLLAVAVSYAPLGVLGWAWHAKPGLVATMALLLSALMELTKLVTLPTRPDPTNLLIAAAAAWAAQTLMRRLLQPAPAASPSQPGVPR